MDTDYIITQLEQHARAIQALARGVTTEQARRRPDEASWSILEVINHLYDEEREDFRPRLELILFRPDEAFKQISPQEWVTERAYNSRDPETSVNNFLAERENSILWLRTLKDPKWEASIKTPQGWTFKAGDMAASWVAHDVLHLRQLTELHYFAVREAARPYDVGYAGDW
jgi:hypothetical protein